MAVLELHTCLYDSAELLGYLSSIRHWSWVSALIFHFLPPDCISSPLFLRSLCLFFSCSWHVPFISSFLSWFFSFFPLGLTLYFWQHFSRFLSCDNYNNYTHYSLSLLQGATKLLSTLMIPKSWKVLLPALLVPHLKGEAWGWILEAIPSVGVWAAGFPSQWGSRWEVWTTVWERQGGNALAINMQGWLFQVGGRRIDLEKFQRAIEQEIRTAVFMVPILVTYRHSEKLNHLNFSGIIQQ